MAPTFTVDRSSSTSLTDQVAHGLVQAIRCGQYEAGDRLPSMLRLAESLGVSEIIVRRAVRRLEDQGDVVPRRGSGVLVADPRRPRWRAHVLYLNTSSTHYFTHLEQALSDLCEGDRVRLTSVYLSRREFRRGLPNVYAALDGQPVDLCVYSPPLPEVERELQRRGIPVIAVNSRSADAEPAGISARVLFSHHEALTALAAHLRECGVSHAASVKGIPEQGCEVEAGYFAAAGIRCELALPPGDRITHADSTDGSPESVERHGYSATLALLAAGAQPDVLYYSDDYAARGGLMALAERGVAVPQTVQVAIHANARHVPIFCRELTRIQVDPQRHAACVHAAITAALAQPGERLADHVDEASFIPGNSTRIQGANPHA